MALIALYARMTGRTYAASRALLAAIVLMLLWNPWYLIFDPGFGLSVTATAGIIWLTPLFERRLLFLRYSFWQNATATTLAAQTGVLPLLLYNTGNLSLVALPANLLVVAVMPLAMAATALAGVSGVLLGQAAPALATFFALPAQALTSYVLLVATYGASLPWAAAALPAFSFGWVLVAYAALAIIASSKRFSSTDQFTLAKKAST
jgi:competence protein ComEC